MRQSILIISKLAPYLGKYFLFNMQEMSLVLHHPHGQLVLSYTLSPA